MKRLLTHNPLTGVSQYFHYDEPTNEIILQTVQENDTYVEANKQEFNDGADRVGRKEEFVKVASIPLALYMDLRKKGILRDPVAMKRWLNDPDNRAFRTRNIAV